MSDESLIRKAGEVRVSMSTLIQVALTVVIGYLLQMMLGMDARLARQEEQIKAIAREAQIHAEHSQESLEKSEETHKAIWDAMRRKQDKR